MENANTGNTNNNTGNASGNSDKNAAQNQSERFHNFLQAANASIQAASSKKAEITPADIETYGSGLVAIEKHLPSERVEEIKAERVKINNIENNEIIEVVRERGELPAEFEKTNSALLAKGINPNLLTPQEAQRVLDYASNATQEIIDKKVDAIADSISRVYHGMKSTRTFEYAKPVPETAERFRTLVEKNERYKSGEIDTSRGFDIEAVLTRKEEELDDFYYSNAQRTAIDEEGASSDDYSAESYRRLRRDMHYQSTLESELEDSDVNELLEEGLIDDEDCFVYGPYTSRDLEDLEIFRTSTWIDFVNSREKSTAVQLLQDTAGSTVDGTEEGLLHLFIAENILPERRLSPKNLLSVVASLGIELSEKSPKELSKVLSKEDATKLRENISWAGYYSAKLLGMREGELRDEYGTKRPVDKAFFEEILKRSEALTEKQEKWMAKDNAPYLTKLDARLFFTEAIYSDILSAKDGDKNFENLALPDNLLGGQQGDIIDKKDDGEEE